MHDKLKYGLFSLVMLFIYGTASATDVTQGGEGKCFLWEVKSKSATVYLMGSFHMFKRDMYPLNECFTNAFRNADTLVVEVNINDVDEDKMAKLFEGRGIYQGEDTIEQHLSTATLAQLKEYLGSHDIDITQVNKMKPWFLSMTIVLQEMIGLGYDPNLGVDMYFLANAHGKDIAELETIEDQMEILAGDPDDVQDLALREALEEIPDLETLMNRMVDAWSKGDADTLDIIIREPEDRYPPLEQQAKRTIDDRNIVMSKKITEFLKTDKTYYIVVGGGHIGGAKGLLSLLTEMGYSVKQLPKVMQAVEQVKNVPSPWRSAYVALSR